MGLDPKDALTAANTWPQQFIGAAATADILTYVHDPVRPRVSWPIRQPWWPAGPVCYELHAS
jgi:hypothetical protein